MQRSFSPWISQSRLIFNALSKIYPDRIKSEEQIDKPVFRFPLINGCNGMAKYLSIEVHPNEDGNRIIDSFPSPIFRGNMSV